MKIVVFGVGGRIGSRIAQEALSRGHTVTGVARDPARVKLAHEGLRVAKGDASDPVAVQALARENNVADQRHRP